MPLPQDRFEVNLELVTVAGTEYTMQANLTLYEDIAELEDDILCFLPTVSELDVFGCELELLNLQTQPPLPEAFRTELLHRPQLQIVVRPCMADGHSIWQFQDDGKESYPKAVRVPANPRGEIADRAFYAAPSIQLRSSVWRKGLSWGAMCCVRSLHQGVSTMDKGCLLSAVP